MINRATRFLPPLEVRHPKRREGKSDRYVSTNALALHMQIVSYELMLYRHEFPTTGAKLCHRALKDVRRLLAKWLFEIPGLGPVGGEISYPTDPSDVAVLRFGSM